MEYSTSPSRYFLGYWTQAWCTYLQVQASWSFRVPSVCFSPSWCFCMSLDGENRLGDRPGSTANQFVWNYVPFVQTDVFHNTNFETENMGPSLLKTRALCPSLQETTWRYMEYRRSLAPISVQWDESQKADIWTRWPAGKSRWQDVLLMFLFGCVSLNKIPPGLLSTQKDTIWSNTWRLNIVPSGKQTWIFGKKIMFL